jgi:hypothetical protein
VKTIQATGLALLVLASAGLRFHEAMAEIYRQAIRKI